LTPFGTVQEYVPDAFAWNRIFSGLLALATRLPMRGAPRAANPRRFPCCLSGRIVAGDCWPANPA
jgi:hypothetical protein